MADSILPWPDVQPTVRYPPPTVLLMEPHDDTRELYHLWLSQCGFAITVPSPGRDLAAQVRGVAPDVAIVEPMGGPDGIALIRALRNEAACADAVVIVLTTQTGPGLRRQAIEAGADAYLVKPCTMGLVAEAISSASRTRLSLVTPGPDRTAQRRQRLREAVRRAHAIGERLADAVVGRAGVDAQLPKGFA